MAQTVEAYAQLQCSMKFERQPSGVIPQCCHLQSDLCQTLGQQKGTRILGRVGVGRGVQAGLGRRLDLRANGSSGRDRRSTIAAGPGDAGGAIAWLRRRRRALLAIATGCCRAGAVAADLGLSACCGVATDALSCRICGKPCPCRPNAATWKRAVCTGTRASMTQVKIVISVRQQL